MKIWSSLVDVVHHQSPVGLNPINYSICSKVSRTALVLFAKAATLHRGFTWSFSPDRPVVGAKSSPKFSDVPK